MDQHEWDKSTRLDKDDLLRAVKRMDLPEIQPYFPAAWEKATTTAVWYNPPWKYYFTLRPFHLGHDEHARRVLVIGNSLTGFLHIAFRYCKDFTCLIDSAYTLWAIDTEEED